jgi:hypothetical protein
MRKFGRPPVLFAVLVLLAFLFSLGVFSAPKASANIPPCGSGELRKTYYSDSSKTTVIGGWRYDCSCIVESWGSTSGYVTEGIIPCP